MSLFVKVTECFRKQNVLETLCMGCWVSICSLLALKEKEKSMIFNNNLKKIQEKIDLDLAFSNFCKRKKIKSPQFCT